MPTPITSKARVLFYPPTSQPRTQYGGHPYAHEYNFAELDRGRPASAAAPPTQQQAFWRQSAVNGLAVVPEVGGAVFRSTRLHSSSDEAWVFTAAGAPSRWRTDDHPDEPWHLVWQEGLRSYVGFSTDPAGGYLQLPKHPAGTSWWVRYILLAPEGTAEQPPPRAGVTVYWGVNSNPYSAAETIGGRLANCARLDMPLASNEPEDAVWSVWAGTTLIDTRPATGRVERSSASADLQWQTVEVLCLGGRILVRTDHDTWTVGGDDYRDGLPEGGMVIRVWGTRAMVQSGVVGYGAQAEVRGPDIHTPDWASFPPVDEQFGGWLISEPNRLMPASHNTPWRVLDSTQRKGRIGMTLQNPGAAVPGHSGHRLTSPVLLRSIVYHPPAWMPLQGQPVDVSCAVLDLTYNLLPSGRGHTASLTLDLETDGLAEALLGGAALVTIDLAHQYAGEIPDPAFDPDHGEPPLIPTPDDEWRRVFTGHVRRRQLVLEEGQRRLQFELQDRTLLWQAPRTAAAVMPSWSAVQFRLAVDLALSYGNTRPDEVVWANLPWSNGIYIPADGGATPAQMSAGSDLIEVLDRLCEVAYHRWSILPDGRILIEPSPAPVAPVAYTITDSDEVEEVERPETGLAAPFDVADLDTVVLVEGRDRWGRGIALLRRDEAAINLPADERYVGYETWARYHEPDNPQPGAVMARHWARARSRGLSVSWSMLGRGLQPGQTVDSTVAALRLGSDSQLVIMSVSGRLTVGDDPPLWKEEYEADLATGGLRGW